MATKIKETKDKLELSSANMDRAASELENMDYDVFKQGAGYEGLKKNYEQQGRVAMQDTIGQVAARTGGMASSYAQTAGQQSYNNYMKTLEDAARSMFEADRQQKMNEFSIASSIYDRDNDAYRDAVADQRYDTKWAYQKERDALADQRYDTKWDYKIGQEEKSADEERKEQAQADVMAIWASGGTPTPEQLEAAGWYNDTIVANDATDMTADNDGDGYPDNLSELGRAYYSQTEIDNYRYPATAQGAENIVNALTYSASMTLSEKDQKNFDYIYGEGAYDAVQAFVKCMSPDDRDIGFDVYQSMNPALFETHYNKLVDKLSSSVPGLSYNQILDIVEKANPNAYKAATDKTWLRFSSYEEWLNTPAG